MSSDFATSSPHFENGNSLASVGVSDFCDNSNFRNTQKRQKSVRDHKAHKALKSERAFFSHAFFQVLKERVA
jgi:hypothetical protein